MRQEISQILKIILRGVNNSVSYIWLKCVWKRAFHTLYPYITTCLVFHTIHNVLRTIHLLFPFIEGSTAIEGLNHQPSHWVKSEKWRTPKGSRAESENEVAMRVTNLLHLTSSILHQPSDFSLYANRLNVSPQISYYFDWRWIVH